VLSRCSKHTLPDLPYDYNALEPIISGEIMKLHHQKHHATYVNNLNVAEEKFNDAKAKSTDSKTVSSLDSNIDCLCHSDDLNTMIHLQPALRFNGGGHINHSIFWQVLSPKEGGNQPSGALADQITKDFGSFDKMMTQLSNASVGVQGSGWGWLGYNKPEQRLQIATCSNQDPLQATTGDYLRRIPFFQRKVRSFVFRRPCTNLWHRRLGTCLLPSI
jgi:Fe-Mn family superoxide dismutase